MCILRANMQRLGEVEVGVGGEGEISWGARESWLLLTSFKKKMQRARVYLS